MPNEPLEKDLPHFDSHMEWSDEALLNQALLSKNSDGYLALIQWRSTNRVIKTMEDLDGSNNRLSVINTLLTLAALALAVVQIWKG
jgi:hypothetical protein